MPVIGKILFSATLIIIFLRPFISQLAFSAIDYYLTLLLFLSACPFIFLNKNRIKTGKIDYFVIVFIFSAFISLITSSNLAVSSKSLYIYIGYILIFYFVRSCDNLQKRAILKIVIFSSLIIGIYGLYQYFFGFKDILKYLSQRQIVYPFASEWLSRRRIFATFFSPNAFAGYLIILLPLSFYLKRIEKNTNFVPKLFWSIVIILSSNLLLSQSLSALLSIFISCGIILLIKKARSKLNLCIYISVALFVFIAIFYLRFHHTDKLFLTPLFSIEKRFDYYREALAIIKQHPLWGVGLGNFKGETSLFVHNSYLQVCIEFGILGLTSLIGMLFMIIKNAAKRIETHPFLFCAFLAFVIHNLMSFTFFLPEVSWIWWIAAGLIIS